MIGRDCTESVFMATFPRSSLDGMIRCEVSTAIDMYYLTLGGLRYAVYGRITPSTEIAPPLLGAMIEDNVQYPTCDTDVLPVNDAIVPGKRLAVLIGVSKYSRRRNNDLEWADDDAVTWYEYLSARGYGPVLFFFRHCKKKRVPRKMYNSR